MIATLTEREMEYAASVARKRHSCHRNADRKDMKVVQDGKAIDALGAQAEFALALALRAEWDGAYHELSDWWDWRDSGHDIGQLEVRSTKHTSGRLILHDKDPDDSPFVLVVAEPPSFCFVGWCYARDGKLKDNWIDVGYGRPCYYVPREDLRPIWELREALR